MAQKMMAAFDAENTKAELRERGNEIGASEARVSDSCRDNNALDADEL